jgi:ATP adenylyltransferase
MKYITAPWREAYVRTAAAHRGCVLCRAAKTRDDAAAHVLVRGRHAFILLNKYPYQPGHLMIAPLLHLASPEDAPPALLAEMAALLRRSLGALRTAYAPHGFNTGMNLGRSAGAGVVGHFHLHVVPRWEGDANFMPVIGRTKALIEALDATSARLRPLLAARRGASRTEAARR